MSHTMTGLPVIHGFRPLSLEEKTKNGDVLFNRKAGGKWGVNSGASENMLPTAWIEGAHPYRWATDEDQTEYQKDANGGFSFTGYFRIINKDAKIEEGDMIMVLVGFGPVRYKKHFFDSSYVGKSVIHFKNECLFRRYGQNPDKQIKPLIKIKAKPLPLP